MSTAPYAATPPTPPDGSSAAAGGESPPGARSGPALVAAGTGLMGGAVAYTGIYSRLNGPDLDLSNFAITVVGTVLLLAAGLAGRFLVTDEHLRRSLVGYPMAAGALALAFTLAILIDSDSSLTTYLLAIVVIAVSAVGYSFGPSGATAVSAVLGLGVLYGQLFTDLLDFDDGGENAPMIGSIGLFVFVLIVTGAAWALPHVRGLVGVVVGAVAIVVFVSIFAALGLQAAFTAAFSGPATIDPTTGDLVPPEATSNPFDNDILVILVLAVLLIALWVVLYHLTGYVGYRVAALLMGAAAVPAGLFALTLERPSIAGAVLLVVGVAFVLIVLAGGRGGGRGGHPAGPGAPGQAGPSYGAPAYGGPQSGTPAYGSPPPYGAPGAPGAGSPPPAAPDEPTRVRQPPPYGQA